MPCPESVGLLLDTHTAEPQRCTATVIGSDRVVTASHCLDPSVRRPGSRCPDVWLAFPARGLAPMEWVGCQQVLRADPIDSGVLRNDVAVLRMERRFGRTPIPIDPRPLEEGAIVTVLAVRPHPIYHSYHELSARLCRVASQSSAVETFGMEAARVGWLMSCPSHPGNSGSPILDGRGRIRALLHGGSAPADGIAIMSAF